MIVDFKHVCSIALNGFYVVILGGTKSYYETEIMLIDEELIHFDDIHDTFEIIPEGFALEEICEDDDPEDIECMERNNKETLEQLERYTALVEYLNTNEIRVNEIWARGYRNPYIRVEIDSTHAKAIYNILYS